MVPGRGGGPTLDPWRTSFLGSVVAGDSSLLGPAPWAAPEPASPRLGRKSILLGVGLSLFCPPSPATPPHTHPRASAPSVLTSDLTAITQILQLQALPHQRPGQVVLVRLRAAFGLLWGPTLLRPQSSAHCPPPEGRASAASSTPPDPRTTSGAPLTAQGLSWPSGGGIALGRCPARPCQQ